MFHIRLLLTMLLAFIYNGKLHGAPAGTFAYVTSQFDITVKVIDTSTDTVTATIPVGAQSVGIAISPDGNRAYLSNASSNTVSVIDTNTNTVTATIVVGSFPVGVAITPDGSQVYVTNRNTSTVSVIDTSTDTVTATIPVGALPVGVAFSPDGTRAYVTDSSGGDVSVIDTNTNTVSTTIPVGSGPFGVAITPDGTHVYVNNQFSNSVSVIDTSTDTVTATISVGSQPVGIAITSDGTLAYTANFGNDTVSVIDIITNTVINTIAVGSQPVGVAITPDGIRVYVTNRNSNTISVIDTSTNTISTSGGPFAISITPDQAPTASFLSTIAVAGTPSSFNASASSSPLGTIANYAWDFGDGTPIENTVLATIQHTFAVDGSFTVTLTVTNSAGTSSVQTFTGQTVSNNGGPSAVTSQQVIVIAQPPVVTGLSPNQGPESGGNQVVITGTNFIGVTAVTFGGVPAASFAVISNTQIEAFAPAGTGTVNVTVTTNSGTSGITTNDQYIYIAERPLPPRHVRTCQIKSLFGYINVVTWRPAHKGTLATSYQVYADASLTILLKIIPNSDPLIFRKLSLFSCRKSYYIVAVDQAGLLSAPVKATVKPGCGHCNRSNFLLKKPRTCR